MNVIDISRSKRIPLTFTMIDDYRETKNKGWSYSCVYSMEEVRDMYLLLRKNGFNGLKDFTYNEVFVHIPARGKRWSERRVLEVLNALVNFKLLVKNKETFVYGVDYSNLPFDEMSFGGPLTLKDVETFKKIFFDYPRFQEFIELFLKSCGTYLERNVQEKSFPVYSVRSNGKYTDVFFSATDNVSEIKVIEPEDINGKKNTSCMMFWDVFVAWARELGMMETFNSKMFDYTLLDGRGFSCSYFLSSDSIILPTLPQFFATHFPREKMVDTSRIIWKICTEYRKPLMEAKSYLIEQYVNNKNVFAPVRTSEIFINRSENKGDNSVAYPRYKDSYISHLMIK